MERRIEGGEGGKEMRRREGEEGRGQIEEGRGRNKGDGGNGKSFGGAILAETNSSLSFTDTSNFTADVGGAIFTYINV